MHQLQVDACRGCRFASVPVALRANFQRNRTNEHLENPAETSSSISCKSYPTFPENPRPICGGTVDTTSSSSSSTTAKPSSAQNKDTCIAIVGLPSNNTIEIRKYCVPKAQGRGVQSAPTETWFVWFSEEWMDTLVDLKFLDTVSGDAVVALRDNKGRSLQTGPLEQFVSVHPRRIQQDTSLYDLMYGTSQNRIDRLTLAKMSSDISGIDPQAEQVLAITDLFVLPTGEGDGRRRWILLSLIVVPRDEEALSRAETAAELASRPSRPRLPHQAPYANPTAETCVSASISTFSSRSWVGSRRCPTGRF